MCVFGKFWGTKSFLVLRTSHWKIFSASQLCEQTPPPHLAIRAIHPSHPHLSVRSHGFLPRRRQSFLTVRSSQAQRLNLLPESCRPRPLDTGYVFSALGVGLLLLAGVGAGIGTGRAGHLLMEKSLSGQSLKAFFPFFLCHSSSESMLFPIPPVFFAFSWSVQHIQLD